MIINELVTKLSFKLDQAVIAKYEQRMKAAANSGNQFGKTMFDAFIRAKKGSDEAARGADNYRDKLGRLRDAQGRFVSEGNKGFGKMGGSMHGLTGSIAKLTAGFVGLSALSSGAKFVGGAASEYETSITQLTTLVGKEKAGGIFKDLQKFAATTPYELKDVMQMFTRLEGAGFGLLDKNGGVKYDALIKLGDLAAASNQPLNMLTDTMLSANRGLGSMVDNFTGLAAKAEDGVLAVEMFDRATGKTTKRKIAAGDKAGFMDFFTQAGARKGIGGGMDALAKTLSGQMSTLKDNAKAAGTSFFLGFGPHIHKYLERMIKLVGDLTPQAEKLGKMVGKQLDKLPAILKAAKPFIEPVAIGLGMIATAMIAMKGFALASGVVSFLGFLGGIGGATVGFITTAFGAISGFFALASGAGLAGTLSIIGTTLGGIVTAALPIIGAILTGGVIVAAIAAIVALGVKLADYWARGDVALKGLHEKFPVLAEGIKYIGDELAAWWPIIQTNLIGGFNAFWPVLDYTFNKILVPALGIGLKWLGILMKVIRAIATVALPPLTAAINGIGTAFQFIWDTFIGPILGLIGGGISDLTKAAGGLVDTLLNAAGINTGGSVGGAGGAGLASTAINFVKSGQADKYAFSLAKANGFVTKSLFQQGIACAQTTDQLLKMAGASKAVQDAMTASAPGSYAALKNRGLATSVSEKDLKPGDLVFYNPGGKGIQHVGVYVGNGQVVDASNSAGGQIGTGQRVIQRKNWMAGNANYLRINDNQWMMPAGGGAAGGAGGTVNNITVDARGASNPELIKTKTKNGVTEALNKAKGLGSGATTPKRGTPAYSQ